jgi:hypothetical protein
MKYVGLFLKSHCNNIWYMNQCHECRMPMNVMLAIW